MASAWGLSWGAAWGNSWGALPVPDIVIVDNDGGYRAAKDREARKQASEADLRRIIERAFAALEPPEPQQPAAPAASPVDVLDFIETELEVAGIEAAMRQIERLMAEYEARVLQARQNRRRNAAMIALLLAS